MNKDEREDEQNPEFQEERQPGEKLHKALAECGAGSRREMEVAIAEGRVWVNGLMAKVGARVLPEDAIALDGKVVSREGAFRHRTLLYYKPTGEVVSRTENEAKPTIFESVPPPGHGRWINVGRLDLDSEGLILLTTDGAWAERLAHPRNEFEREYLARVYGDLSEDDITRARAGLVVDGKPLVPAAFEVRAQSGNGRNRWYRVVLKEGRNRAVRRLFAALGCTVSRLLRVRYGPFVLPRDLRPGEWREAPDLSEFSSAAPETTERGRDRDREERGGRDGFRGGGGFRDSNRPGGWRKGGGSNFRDRDRDSGFRGRGPDRGPDRDRDSRDFRPRFRDDRSGGWQKGGGSNFRDRDRDANFRGRGPDRGPDRDRDSRDFRPRFRDDDRPGGWRKGGGSNFRDRDRDANFRGRGPDRGPDRDRDSRDFRPRFNDRDDRDGRGDRDRPPPRKFHKRDRD